MFGQRKKRGEILTLIPSAYFGWGLASGGPRWHGWDMTRVTPSGGATLQGGKTFQQDQQCLGFGSGAAALSGGRYCPSMLTSRIIK